MLYNLEPDRSVTGGAWYSDQDFESEFVEVLNQQCLKYLEQKVGKVLVYSATNDQCDRDFQTILDYCLVSTF